MMQRTALVLLTITAIVSLGYYSAISSATIRAPSSQQYPYDATTTPLDPSTKIYRELYSSLDTYSSFGRSAHIDNLRTSWGSVRQKALPIFTLEGDKERKRKGSHKWLTGSISDSSAKKSSKGSANQKSGKGKDGGTRKGMMSTKSSGSSKSSRNPKKKGKGSSKGALDDICDQYDFRNIGQKLMGDGELCTPNVLEAAESIPSLSTFVDLLGIAGLTDIFSCLGPFTLLAPTNDAFDTLDPMVLIDLIRHDNREQLQELLLYHILPGLILSDDLDEGALETLSGADVLVSLEPTMFNDANVESDNISACNGAIYGIGSVLSPSPLVSAPPAAGPSSTTGPTMTPATIPNLMPTSVDSPTTAPSTSTAAQTELPTASSGTSLVPTPELALTPIPTTTGTVMTPVTSPMPTSVDSPTTASSTNTAAQTELPTAPSGTSLVPTPEFTMAPTPSMDLLRVRVEDYYIAYRAPDATVAPTKDEYQAMRANTTMYIDQFFANAFANDPTVSFVGVESILMETKFGDETNIPSVGFNIYMQYQYSEFTFQPGSMPPDAAAALGILSSAMTVEYILNYPRAMTGTPFESTAEVLLSTIPNP